MKKGPTGDLLEPNYMVKLLNFVTQTSRRRREAERSEIRDKRLKAYKAKQFDKYRDYIIEEFYAHDKMCEVV